MIILKFGGTSVNTVGKLQTIYKIIKKVQKNNPIIVVSAIRGVTDLLLSLIGKSTVEQKKVLEKLKEIHINFALELSGENSSKELIETCNQLLHNLKTDLSLPLEQKMLTDKIVSYGEILSTNLVSFFLNQKGVLAEPVIATSIIVTDNNFGAAEFLPKYTKEKAKKIIIPLIKKGGVPVITGFIGATKNNQVTTFGRGGSDYTASILGYCLGAKEIQFWKDVDGMYTADPRVVKNARLLSALSYEEASLLVEKGAKILHSRTIASIRDVGIPIRIMNTLRPDGNGTVIKNIEENYI